MYRDKSVGDMMYQMHLARLGIHTGTLSNAAGFQLEAQRKKNEELWNQLCRPSNLGRQSEVRPIPFNPVEVKAAEADSLGIRVLGYVFYGAGALVWIFVLAMSH